MVYEIKLPQENEDYINSGKLGIAGKRNSKNTRFP
jgi:hypothetical protein